MFKGLLIVCVVGTLGRKDLFGSDQVLSQPWWYPHIICFPMKADHGPEPVMDCGGFWGSSGKGFVHQPYGLFVVHRSTSVAMNLFQKMEH